MKKQFSRFSRSPKAPRQPSRYSNVQQRIFKGERQSRNVQNREIPVEQHNVGDISNITSSTSPALFTKSTALRKKGKKQLYITPDRNHGTVSRSRLRRVLLNAHLRSFDGYEPLPRDIGKPHTPKTVVDLPEPSVDEIVLPPVPARNTPQANHQRTDHKQQQESKQVLSESLRAPKSIPMDTLAIEPVELQPGVLLTIAFARRSEKDSSRVATHAVLSSFDTPINSEISDERLVVHQVRQSVHGILHRHTLLERGSTLVCAVSGGSDSVVLLDVMSGLAHENGFRLIVAHVNHQLRGKEADDDEIFVEQLAKKAGWDFYGATANVREYARDEKLSIEAAARQMRYKFLEFVAYKTTAQAVLTAHILDDTVETFLLNLVRGAGLTGLSGIPEVRTFAQIAPLVRPLLQCKKEQMLEYCRVRGLLWREDSSNTLSVYTRNKIRHQLIPFLQQEFSPAIVDVIHRTSKIIQQADVLVASIVEQSIQTVVDDVHLPHSVCFRIDALQSLPPFVRNEVLHRVIEERFSGDRLSFEAIERIARLLQAGLHTQADINKRLLAIRDREHIVVITKSANYAMDVRIEKNNGYDFAGCRIHLQEVDRKKAHFSGDPAVEFLDSALLPYRLTLRTWKPGDKFQPLGMNGTINVSDYLSNSKISFLQRQQILVLATNTDIVWVCGMRINEHYKITNTTQMALRLEFRTIKNSMF